MLAGCYDDPVIIPGSVAGTYQSTVMIMPNAVDMPDSMHLRGGFIRLTLRTSGEAVCTTHVVDREGGGSATISAGTYAMAGDTLRLSLSEDPFISSLTWIVRGSEIRNTPVAAIERVEFVLRKQ